MVAVLKALVAHLRDNRERLVREQQVIVQIYDPTFGLRTDSETIEVIDFDALCNEIDRFTQEFQQ